METILTTAKSDKSSEIDVNVTVISIGSSEMETKKDDVPLNLTTDIKKEVDSSVCSTSKIYLTCRHIPKSKCKTVKVSQFGGVHCCSKMIRQRLND